MTPTPRQSDTPRPGCYLLRLVRKGPWVAAEITRGEGGWRCMLDNVWQGPSHDPWSLPNMEKIHWGGRETTPSEAAYRAALSKHAKTHEPDSPEANPRRPIDINTLRYKRKTK